MAFSLRKPTKEAVGNMPFIFNFLKAKRDLESFSYRNLNILAQHYNITAENVNDRLWLLAIAILSNKSLQKKAHMQSVFADFNEYFEEYRLLGKGGFGKVILVKLKKDYKNLSKGKKVAIKLLDTTEMTGTDLERLEREIDILKNLSFGDDCNPHISCYYDYFETELNEKDFIGIIMEYIPGKELGKYMNTGPISNIQTLKFMKALSGALKYMHSKNIVHRDIKPANIMVETSNNIPKYIDFGFSCFTILDHKYECKLDVQMSPVYLSPERWRVITSRMKLSPEKLFNIYKTSDVWALGIIFYEMLFDRLPLEIEKVLSISHKTTNDAMQHLSNVLMNEDITFPRDFVADPQLIKIVKGMLKRLPSERSGISEIAERLDKISV